MADNPMEVGFASQAQELYFKKNNPKFYKLIIKKFGSYMSGKHQKMLKQHSQKMSSRRAR